MERKSGVKAPAHGDELHKRNMKWKEIREAPPFLAWPSELL